jgi:PAS domain S-box-containing protein
MPALDVRTISLIFFINSFVATLVMVALWRQSRKQVSGTHLWLICFALQTAMFLLFALRNVIPDVFSIWLANTGIAVAAFILYVGLERFTACPSPQRHNHIILGVFVCLFTYFTFFQPDVAIRIVLISTTVMLMFLQSAWLMLYRVEPELRPLTRAAGIVCILYVLNQCYRIVIALLMPSPGDLLNANVFDTFGQAINATLFIGWVFVLVLMVNRRIVIDFQKQEEKLVSTKVEIEIGKLEMAEVKRAVEALNESENKFKMTLSEAPIGIAMVGLDKRFLNCNKAFCEFLAYSEEEIKQKTINDITFPDDVEIGMADMRAIVAGEKKTSTVQKRYLRKDGAVVWGEVNINLIRNINGQPLYFLPMIQDITERKKTQEALRESENMYKSLVGNVPAIIFTIDLEGKITFVSQRVEEILGYESAEAINMNILNFIPEEDRQRAMESLQKGMTGEKVTHFQTPMIKKSGERLILECSFTRVYKNGALIGAQGTAVDITDRKRAETAHNLNSERMKALLQLNQMTEATLQEITDFTREEAVRLTGSTIGYLAFLNEEESVLTMHSWSKSAMAECAISDKPIVYPIVTTGLWGEAVRQRRAVITNDYAAANPLKKGYPHGHVAVKRHMNTPVFEGSRIVIVAGVGNKAEEYNESDVQQLTLLMEAMWRLLENKRANNELLKLNAELEQRVIERTSQLETVNKELEAFSYSVSHDLRAPLRSIDGFSQALLQDYPDLLDEQGKNYLQRVRSNTQRMGELIDDLLKLSRVTRSEMKLEMVNLSTLAQSIANELQQTQPGRQVEFVITLGLNASGDANLLRLLLEHLLGNAWKFTEKHSQARIEFGSTRVDGEQVFFVRDDGAGFDMTYADKLFAPFQRLHSAGEFPGIGIGLATVQRIIHRHGGRVWAEGEIEKGAIFYFTLAQI